MTLEVTDLNIKMLEYNDLLILRFNWLLENTKGVIEKESKQKCYMLHLCQSVKITC